MQSFLSLMASLGEIRRRKGRNQLFTNSAVRRAAYHKRVCLQCFNVVIAALVSGRLDAMEERILTTQTNLGI